MNDGGQRMNVLVPRLALTFVLDNADFCDRGPTGNGWPSVEMVKARRSLEQALKEEGTNMKTEVTFTYKNYRGETSVRLVRPIMIAFGTTGFHPEPQWLLHAWDLKKDGERIFAMKDIKDWEEST